MSIVDRILGPRIPKEERGEDARKYQLPTWMFTGAALLLMVSLLLPYWVLYLKAPQFPNGLQVRAYVNRLEGDVGELEGLNHYVGLKSFDDGAVFERSVAVISVIVLAGLLVAALLVRTRWVLLLVLPGLLFPFIFIGDLQFWLWKYGNQLDPRAPLAAAVGEFTPPVFGPAKIAQFDTLALPGPGLVLAFIASAMIAVGLWYHRKAYKPLIEKSAAK